VVVAAQGTLVDGSGIHVVLGNMLGGARAFDGQIDEVAIWSRALDGSEISGLYARGAARVTAQVETCTQADCSDGVFGDAAGSAGGEIDPGDIAGNGLPSTSLSGYPTAQYARYRLLYSSSAPSAALPAVSSVSLGYATGESGGEGQGSSPADNPLVGSDACIDVSSSLIPDYVGGIPQDPRYGSGEITGYAVRTENERIQVRSCTPELDLVISASK